MVLGSHILARYFCSHFWWDNPGFGSEERFSTFAEAMKGAPKYVDAPKDVFYFLRDLGIEFYSAGEIAIRFCNAYGVKHDLRFG